MQFHLLGIGGAGMSVVALILHAQGHQVSGSDRQNSDTLEFLRSKGIEAYFPHQADLVNPEAIIVRSSAIKADNPEIILAVSRGQEVWHRSQALAFAAQDRDLLAVAGAHGKSTTSALIAYVLQQADYDPSFAIGAVIKQLGSGAKWGTGDFCVVEADESDASFLNYHPRLEIVTNVEPDHLDHYGTKEAFAAAFVQFATNLPPNGHLICCTDDPGARELAAAAAAQDVQVWTYGFIPPDWQINGQVHAQINVGGKENAENNDFEFSVLVNPHLDSSTLNLDPKMTAKVYPVKVGVPGLHNQLNSAAVLLAVLALGIDLEKIIPHLATFNGAGRRWEQRGEINGVRVIDDYAHHPTEIAATIKTARKATEKGRVLTLFQPHLYSRTRNFATQFAKALGQSDILVVTSAYAARETPEQGVDGDAIIALLPTHAHAEFIENKVEAAKQLARLARPGDLLFTMGAGDVTEIGDYILDILASKDQSVFKPKTVDSDGIQG